MAIIATDQRRVVAGPAPELLKSLRSDRLRLLDLQIRIAKDLATVDEHASFVFESAASTVEWAACAGYDAYQAMDLLGIGKAMRCFAELEGRLRSGAIGTAGAAQMGRLCLRPGFVMPGDNWINDATILSLKDLKRKIKTRLEEKRTGQTGLAEMHFVVPQATRSKFDRCREKACTRAKMQPSDGQVLDRMCDNYLEDPDPLKRDSGGGRRGRRAR